MIKSSSCVSCGGCLFPFDRIDQFCLVSSDCRPWKTKADLLLCEDCGLVQRARTEAWKQGCARIYQSYFAYPQGSETDQKVKGRGGGALQSRSAELLKAFKINYPLLDQGTWLDIGCGQGHLLRLCAQQFPGMDLVGIDASEASRPYIEQIERAVFFSELEDCETPPSIISMVHVLEHIPWPQEFLINLQKLMSKHSLLLIQIPTFIRNPIDLLIYDHGTFFTEESLGWIANNIGFSVESMEYVAGNKELLVVLKKANRRIQWMLPAKDKIEAVKKTVASSINYLEDIKREAQRISKENHVRIFGSSIGASWLYSELGSEGVECFLDQDQERVGNTFLGKPILPAVDIKLDRTVFPLDPATRQRLLAVYGQVDNRLSQKGAVHKADL